jgi:hypothetical protein
MKDEEDALIAGQLIVLVIAVVVVIFLLNLG